jgi:hypothetical protein
MQRPLYRANVETEKCAVLVLANGCPAFQSDGPDKLQSGVMLNLWANAGRNHLKVEMAPPSGSASLADVGAVFRCKVTVHDMAEPPASRQTLTLLEFAFDPQKDAQPYPLVLDEAFDAPSPFPEWTWQRSPRLQSDDALMREVVALAQRLWDALNRKDLDAILGMQPIKVREMAQALFKRTDAMNADMRDHLARVVESPSGSLLPLDADAIELKLFAEDRLLCVNHTDGRRAIRYQLPDGLLAQIPLYLTRGDQSKLVWVR